MMKIITLFLTTLFLLTACTNENKMPLTKPILTESGINSLTSKTQYVLNAIAPNLLGYEITNFTALESGESKSIMRVSYQGHEVMIITPTKPKEDSQQYIKSISITSDYVENPFNIKIGDTYNRDNFSTCEELKEGLTCKKDKFKNILLIFKKNNKTWSLKEIVWSGDA
ncbi:MAG: hypothetical protein NTW78_01215 [Campylobacterales bacterium]|nr:hypothetical protein [Campylobacterales bacterium]